MTRDLEHPENPARSPNPGGASDRASQRDSWLSAMPARQKTTPVKDVGKTDAPSLRRSITEKELQPS
jgi:hypothetical protein